MPPSVAGGSGLLAVSPEEEEEEFSEPCMGE